MLLGVNIDHAATLRQARYARMPDAAHPEPDLLAAAAACERAGADGITAHLRADRRHIRDRDIERLRENVMTKLNLEMGNTAEMLDIALRILPEDVCLVPEEREEITTEGGLEVAGQQKQLGKTVQRLQNAGIRVSMFIEPDPKQIRASADLGAEAVELHTGAFANAAKEQQEQELQRLIDAAVFAHGHNLRVNAGHGLNYRNVRLMHRIPHLHELNIGHSIISRALFVGLETAVTEMLQLLQSPKPV